MNEDERTIRCFFPEDAGRSWDQMQSAAPSDRDVYDKCEELILGHLTSSRFLASIRTSGLSPDLQKERKIEDGVPSDAESVYLAARFDRYYLNRAIQEHGGRGLIVVVQVPKKSLAPDEAWLVGDSQDTSLAEQLFLTLQAGSCKHRGVVPVSRILGYFDEHGRPWQDA